LVEVAATRDIPDEEPENIADGQLRRVAPQ
jgi:hypothetical protein